MANAQRGWKEALVQEVKQELETFKQAQDTLAVQEAKNFVRREAAAAANEAIGIIAQDLHNGTQQFQAAVTEQNARIQELIRSAPGSRPQPFNVDEEPRP